MYGFLNAQIEACRQVYMVCPRVEEGEADGPDALNAVKTYYKEVAQALLPGRRVGLMHGKLKPREKAAVMEAFKAGELDALVSTTVIEVGVDVPNAAVMVIENAERYGLSALHQLRGRIGRGSAKSYCILVSDAKGDTARQRLLTMKKYSDGFQIADEDLRLRGPGDFFGKRQHGLPELRLADMVEDMDTLRLCRDCADTILADDPNLDKPKNQTLLTEKQDLLRRSTT